MFSRQVYMKWFISSQLQSDICLFLFHYREIHTPPYLQRQPRLYPIVKRNLQQLPKLKFKKSSNTEATDAPKLHLRLKKSYLMNSLLTLRQRHHLSILWFTHRSAQIHWGISLFWESLTHTTWDHTDSAHVVKSSLWTHAFIAFPY